MKAASSSSLVFKPLLSGRAPYLRTRTRRPCLRMQGTAGRDSDDRRSDSGMVDENMIVLRKRIQEMKMAEMNYDAPSHWMEWEKRYYYASYYSDVCEGVGQLQRFLMSTRPGVALGMLLLLASSLPISVFAVLLSLIK